MKERYGEKVAERYLESFNECQKYAICVAVDDKKQVAEMFKMLTDVIVKSVGF